MSRLRIITASDQSATITVVPETTVRQLRLQIAERLGLSPDDDTTVDKIKLNFKGRLLLDDDAVWADIPHLDDDKLYVAVDTSTRSRQATNSHGSVRAQFGGTVGGGSGGTATSASSGLPELPPGFADAIVNNLTPQTIEAYFQMIPELRNLQREHPEMARELRDPDTFRQLMRSQLDPTSRRAAEQARGAQLAQLNAVPGGWAMAERMMHSLQRDEAREPADGDLSASTMSGSDMAMPRPGYTSNNEPLPNPWARAAPAPQPTTSPAAPFSFTGAQNVASHPTPPASAVQRGFTSQLRMMTEEMGFDEDTAKLALDQTGGDVDAAVNLIATWTDE